MSHVRSTLISAGALPVDIHAVATNARAEDDELNFLRELIYVAADWVENYTRRCLITATWTLKLDQWNDERYVRPSKYTAWDGRHEMAIFVPRPPLGSVTSIQYIDDDGNTQTLATSKYRVDTASTPGRITVAYNETLPSIREVTGAVTITHTAGYGATYESVPIAIRHAIAMLATDLYDKRNATGCGEGEVFFGVSRLLAPYVLDVYA